MALGSPRALVVVDQTSQSVYISNDNAGTILGVLNYYEGAHCSCPSSSGAALK